MTKDKPSFETVSWTDGGVVLLDQRLLPGEEVDLCCATPQDVMAAIRNMVVRGAPAIGVTAAMGIALGARQLAAGTPDDFDRRFAGMCDDFAATRPTAVNLFWAIDRMKRVAAAHREAGPAAVAEALVSEACTMKEEDIAACRALGGHGAELVPEGAAILTHCNAGALATAGYGTALGVVRAAVEAGKDVHVLADETRPFLQGARLTAWELSRDAIPVTVITDGMAGHFMHRGKVDVVVVGADRIAANGDTANKIGTYQLAVMAKENDIPFYVAAPTSTVDPNIAHGDDIPIEERDPEEVMHMGTMRTTPEGVSAAHPAFDVTPHRYVTAIITEVGVVRPPFVNGLREALALSLSTGSR
jgi:methylthioribose-1-phosphate isomerase